MFFHLHLLAKQMINVLPIVQKVFVTQFTFVYLQTVLFTLLTHTWVVESHCDGCFLEICTENA